MKLKTLTIHNLASIEDATIDFEKEPLSGSEVFLISGKTGAGKSTILDAIALALYANTPRFVNSIKGDSVERNSGQPGVERPETLMNDPRQILRRGSGEGFARLRFLSNDEVDFVAEWSVRRAHNKPSGTIQGKKWTLRNESTGEVYERDSEIKSRIASAVGLDFNQFCRTTMLAQGDFARFLDSDDKEKADILEKITGMARYSKIGRRINLEFKKREAAWNTAQERVGGIVLLTDDQKKEISYERGVLDKRYAELRTLTEAETRREGWLNSMVADAAALEAAGRELSGLSDGYIKFVGGMMYLEKSIEEGRQRIDVLERKIQAEEKYRFTYENLGALQAVLAALSEGRKTIRDRKKEIEERRKDMDANLTPRLKGAREKLKSLEEEVKAATENVAAVEKEIEKAGLSALRSRHRGVAETISALKIAAEKLKAYRTATRAYETRTRNLRQIRSEEKDATTRAANLKPLLDSARAVESATKEASRRQSLATEKFPEMMRATLKPGDVCPVCLREIQEAFVSEESLKAAVKAAHEAFLQAEKARKEVEEKLTLASAEAKARGDMAVAQEKELKRDADTVETSRKETLLAFGKAGMEEICAESEALLSERMQAAEGEEKRIGALIDEAEKKEKRLKELRKRSDEIRKKSDAAAVRLRDAEAALSAASADIKAAETVIEAKKVENTAAAKKIGELVRGEWTLRWEDDPVAFSRVVSDRAKAYDDILKQKSEEEALTGERGKQLDEAREAQRRILARMPEWEAREARGPEEVNNLAAHSLALSENLAAVLEKIKTLGQRLEESREAIASYEEAHPEAKGETAADVRVRKEGLEKETGENREKAGALARRLEEDEENLRTRQRLLEESETIRKEYESWWRLDRLLGDAQGNKFKKIAQSYVLDNLIASANHYLASLNDRYSLASPPGSLMITVEDAWQGYEKRATSTLSGGETFLVSLALALGLSDIGETLGVDILFIDEGFGSLSGEPLQKAVSTLRSLHSATGKHVGIISHIEELRERIPVQIHVDRPGQSPVSTVSVVSL